MATRRAVIDSGDYTLDVTFSADADLDGRFRATCNDTGDTLMINGWLIENVEFVDENEER